MATSDAELGASESGSAADPVLIIGPTNGGTVVINRNNTTFGTDVIDEAGASDVTIENLGLVGGHDGVDLGGVSNGVTLLNDSISGAGAGGIVVANAGTITGLVIANSAIHDNTGPGINLQDGLISAILSDDQVYDSTADGIDISSYYGNATVSRGCGL